MSNKMLYLVGPPAGGKSSTMRAILEQLEVATGDWFKIWPANGHAEFRGEPLHDIYTDEVRGLSLGVTRPGGFSGTDAIGMASSSEAMAWIQNADTLPDLILGEGARLCSGKWFSAVAARCDLTVGHISAPKEVLDARCDARGSTQKPTFRAGAETRARNAAQAAEAAGALVLWIDSEYPSPQQMAAQFLERAGITSPLGVA